MDLANDARLTIAHLAPFIRRRELSPVELTESVLSRISCLQPRLNAFITVTADSALAQAKRAEREILQGRYRGSLHGIPVSLKDLLYTRGIRTTAGSRIMRRFVPVENATVVDRLLEAGAILVGKTNLHEFAFGVTSVNPHYGPVHNPWDLTRVSGGSSGGSAAAVVMGLSLASLGTDTGGSIRIPAAACGCVGLKPTQGRVSLRGVVPLAQSLDHVGPLSRCVEDAALVLSEIAGADPGDSLTVGSCGEKFARDLRKGVRGLRIGLPKEYFFDRLDRDVRQCVLSAVRTLERSGAEIREVALQNMQETANLAALITLGEALVNHWKWLQKRPQDYGLDLRTRMLEGKNLPAVDYLRAIERRRAYRESFIRAMETVDVLAAPALPIVAPQIGDDEVVVGRWREDVRLALLRLTRPANLTGLPAICVPCGFSREGLPMGLQLTGRWLGEAVLLRAAYAYEQASPWHKQFPPDFGDRLLNPRIQSE